MLVGIRSFSCRSVFMVLHYFHICTQKKRVNFVIGLHAFGYGSVFYIQLVTNCNQLKNVDKKVQKHGLLERNVGKQGLNR